jgi:hypothetical protein
MQVFIIAGLIVVIVQLFFITKKLNKMGEVNDLLLAEAQKTADSLKKIRVDIATLAAGVNPVGGLTEDEAQALLVKLQALSGDAADVDALTADPAPAPEPAPEA